MAQDLREAKPVRTGGATGPDSGRYTWTVEALLAATGGRLAGGAAGRPLGAVCTDTRSLAAGDIFVALTGARFDGHAFVAEAVQKGVGALVVARLPEPMPQVPVLLVDDTLRALGDLAAHRRRSLPELLVLAITGSSGKTTVKELTAAICGQRFQVLKTKGNFNNLVGLPLCLLPATGAHRIAVLEMGMNSPGELSRLAEIAAPDVACITNVQPAHLAGLGDLAGVARAKEELFRGVREEGLLVVNADDPLVRAMARRYCQRQITFGLRKGAEVRATHIGRQGPDGLRFTLHLGGDKARVRLGLVGRHNVANALAAAALAFGAGLDLAAVKAGLEAYASFEKRMQILRLPGGPGIVNDSYNANPGSMLAALEAVRDLRNGRKGAAVLGDMLELGRESEAAHRLLGQQVAGRGFQYLCAVGEYARYTVEAARRHGMAEDRARELGSKEEIVRFLQGLIREGLLTQGDWILVKGSRGMRMETVVDQLLTEGCDPLG